MSVPSPIESYHLGIGFANGQAFVGARGPAPTLNLLMQLPSAQRIEDFVLVPGTRMNVMAVEAVATPVSVAPEYIEWRRTMMEPPLAWQADVDQALHSGGYKPRPLLPHQLHFLAGLNQRHRSALNASEQGTGKTTTGWLAMQLWNCKRGLIICPKSLIREWEREWKVVWEGDRPVQCVPLDYGTVLQKRDVIRDLLATDDLEPTALVINYEIVDSLGADIERWCADTVICDESWRIKNPQAQCTKATLKLCDKADHVLLLTGTPVGNHIGDLWSQIRALGKELMPENYWRFLHRYAVMQQIQLGPRTVFKPVDIADPVGLMQRLEPVWYRATKAACLDLPPKQYEEVRLEMPAATRRIYRQVEDEGEVALGHDLSLASEATILLRLHQMCGGFRLEYNEQTGEMLCHETRCPKIDWIADFCNDRLMGAPESRVIIWANYTHELERITAIVNKILGPGKAVMCWGGSDNDQIEEWKRSFKSRSEDGVQVLVCQLKKMAFGHNLQEADYHIYFSNNWSYVVRSQSEDRSHRAGRHSPVKYFDLVLDNSVDVQVRDALARKTDFAVRCSPDTAVKR